MANQALSFGEGAVGAVLLVMGISGASVREVLAGRGGKIRPLKGGATASSGVSTSPGAGGAHTTAFVTPGKNGTVNPLPGWSRSRIDQGVDFYGGAKIVAPEAGTVISTGAPGWPEGGGVLLRTAGGKIVYFYEGLTATVKAGEQVIAGQQIATGTPGGSIEVGFADASGVPLSHAEYYEGKVTVFGRKAAQWLNLLGAPR